MTYGEKDTILYYPSIKIEDGPWLRNAVLYWDKIASIVPGIDYQEENSMEIEYLLREGFYEPIYPIELESDRELLVEFCNQVKEQLTLQKTKRRQGRMVEVHVNKTMYIESQINTLKTPESILDFLLEEGIAKRKNQEWIHMTNGDSFVYMSLLAKFLAKMHNRMQIGTDVKSSFMSPFIMNGARRNSAEKQIYLNVAINNILPCPQMDGVTIEDLLDFKKDHKRELDYFRRRINEYQHHIDLCCDRNAMMEMTYDFRKSIEDDMNEIEEYMRSRWKSVVRGSVTALLPLGISYFEMKGYLPQNTGLVASAVAGINTSFRYVKKDFTVNNNNAFLFSAMKEGVIVPNRK